MYINVADGSLFFFNVRKHIYDISKAEVAPKQSRSVRVPSTTGAGQGGDLIGLLLHYRQLSTSVHGTFCCGTEIDGMPNQQGPALVPCRIKPLRRAHYRSPHICCASISSGMSAEGEILYLYSYESVARNAQVARTLMASSGPNSNWACPAPRTLLCTLRSVRSADSTSNSTLIACTAQHAELREFRH